MIKIKHLILTHILFSLGSTGFVFSATAVEYECIRPYEPIPTDYSIDQTEELKNDYRYYLKDVESYINCENAVISVTTVEIGKVRKEAINAINRYDQLISKHPAKFKHSDVLVPSILDEDLPERGKTFD